MRLKLSERWEAKIEANRKRDTYNRRLLKDAGWTVIRLWEHQILKFPARCRQRIRAALNLQEAVPPGNVAAAPLGFGGKDDNQGH